jgi:hypothetical protein
LCGKFGLIIILTGHLLRRIDVFVTSVLGELHEQLEPFYSDTGRPSINPELMIRGIATRFAPMFRHGRWCA